MHCQVTTNTNSLTSMIKLIVYFVKLTHSFNELKIVIFIFFLLSIVSNRKQNFF